MNETGVIHGRFQVIHNDHLKYLLEGKKRCRQMIVGITNPDPTLTMHDPADPARSDPLSNPLTYFERLLLVRAALVEAGVSLPAFVIVPFPVNMPELYKYYVPLDAAFFLSIYDDWGRKKLSQFESLGLRTEILSERPYEQKGLSSTDVRKRMAMGQAWEHLVPAAAASLLTLWKIPERLRELYEASQDR